MSSSQSPSSGEVSPPELIDNGEGPSRFNAPRVTVSTPKETKAEKKKRVGFAGDPSPPREEDYFSHTPVGGSSQNNTPGITPGIEGVPKSPARRDSFDRAELTEALEKILKPEDHSGPLAAPVVPDVEYIAANLRLPAKPVLRKTVYPESPAVEPVEGLSHPSEIEARNRAGRLAESVSRRTSMEDLDDDSSHYGLLDGTDIRDHAHDHNNATAAATSSGVSPPEHGQAQTQAPLQGPDAEGLTYRKRAETDADRLVRRYTKRRARDETLLQGQSSTTQTAPMPPTPMFMGPRSGTATPVAYDLEYVPPAPPKYHGGVLGTLLKLSMAEGVNSGQSTPGGGTPTRTPNRTPRNSPPSTTPGTPRTFPDPPSRPRSGLFGLGSRHSSSTLAELIGSSSTLAAPASSTGAGKDWSDEVKEKLRREREKPKKEHKRKSSKTQKAQQLLITKHIAEIISRHRYLVKLCRALMEYGAPTHRLEAYMAMSARVLAIQGQFLYLPGCMVISFDDEQTHTTEVKIVRAGQGVDLGKLRDVHEIYKLVVHDLISVDDAMSRLDAVINKKPKFNKPVRVVFYGLAAVTVAPFAFDGRWIDLPIAFIMGCCVGLMQLVAAPSSELYANVFEISAALLMAFLGRMFGSIMHKGERLFCFSALAQSSIALILPGYMVLCGSLELQSHNMIAGSVRMVYAMIYTLFLGYGVTIGATLYGLMDKNAVNETTCTNTMNTNWHFFFVPLFTLCLCVINQAKFKQLPVMLIISMAGYVVNNFVQKYTSSSTVSGTIGALMIGTLANIYSRTSRHAENFWLDLWELHIQPRLQGLRGLRPKSASKHDPELALDKDGEKVPKLETDPLARRVGYGLAAAAMLPAIFVQVPSGLASGGSLVAGVISANAITGNKTAEASSTSSDISSGAFSVLGSVIQVAISISVGLSLAALLVYPFGKRRSGLFSF